jgi:hypothetical protein
MSVIITHNIASAAPPKNKHHWLQAVQEEQFHI